MEIKGRGEGGGVIDGTFTELNGGPFKYIKFQQDNKSIAYDSTFLVHLYNRTIHSNHCFAICAKNVCSFFLA